MKKNLPGVSAYVDIKPMSLGGSGHMLTLHFEAPKDAPSSVSHYQETYPTKLGEVRLKDLFLLMFTRPEIGSEHQGWVEQCYDTPHTVDLDDAQRMVKTLTLIKRALERIEKRYGRPESWEGHARRLFDVLGVTEVRFSHEAVRTYNTRRERTDPPLSHTDMDVAMCTIRTIIEAVCTSVEEKKAAS